VEGGREGSASPVPWFIEGDSAALLRELLSRGSSSQNPANPGQDTDRREPVEGEVSALEGALMELRADSIEATGDLEAKTLEWARDRQEADTKLLDYRDRARELTNRIRLFEDRGGDSRCPTCGRPLGGEAGRLISSLSDELEAVVQDGKWWKKRRAQLDEKPKELQGMEEGALRLHARVEEAAERLQLARGGRFAGERMDDPVGSGPAPAGRVPETPDLETSLAARRLLRRSANLLSAMTEGRISGLRVRGQRLLSVGAGGREEAIEGTDLAALRLAIRFSAWKVGDERPGGSPPLLLTELGGPATEPLVSQAVEAVAEWVGEGQLVVVVTPPSVAENLPERLARVLELTLDPRGRWLVRRIPCGMAALAVTGGP
jgi:hypothetical protein